MNFVQLFALVLGLVLAGMVPDSDAPLGLDHLTVFLSILPPVSSFGPGFFERIGNVLFFGVGGGALAFLLLLIVDVHQSQPRALTPVWFVVACLASLLDTVLSPICGMRPFLELSALLFDNGPGVAAIKEMLVKSRETLRSQADTIRGLNATIARLNGRFYDITQVYHVETRSLRKGTIQPAVEGTYPWRVPSVFHRLCKYSISLLLLFIIVIVTVVFLHSPVASFNIVYPLSVSSHLLHILYLFSLVLLLFTFSIVYYSFNLLSPHPPSPISFILFKPPSTSLFTLPLFKTKR